MTTLIISEKPNAAERIATALSNGNVKKEKNGKAVWFEINRNGEKILVVPAVGHLFTLKQKGDDGWIYPVFETEWAPSFEVNKSSAFSKIYFNNFKRLSKLANKFVVATDYDYEGSVIGYNILRFICGTEDAKRMKFSTLTPDELRESYENVMDLDFPQINVGIARHKLDWLYGINISRALTLAIKKHKNYFKVLSTGRVQGPTLKIISKKEEEIEKFVPEKYWEMEAHLKLDESEIIAQHEEGRFKNNQDPLSIKKKCENSDAIVFKVTKRKYKQNPPYPFDLTTLQTEAYSAFGFSPTQTLNLAQSLYESGLISYPRTSSQKLPEKIGYKNIIKNLRKQREYKRLADMLLGMSKLKPNEGKKTDSAHPSIFPTGERPKELTTQEKKLYDLIVRRFLAVFGGPAIREVVDVTFDINGEKFLAKGKRTVEKNWIEFYEKYVKYDEQVLPELQRGDVLKVLKIDILEKETQPPKRYTEASLVRKLEKLGLGTKATRATIIKTLFDRGYIKDKKIRITSLGKSIVKTLDKYCPEILSERLTRKFEEDMEGIENGRYKKEDVIENAKNVLEKILEEFKKNEEKIGEELYDALIETKNNSYIIGKCPECGRNLRIIRSKRTGKRFVGCEGYKDGCRVSYPLPQVGKIEPAGVCKVCGAPMIKLIRKGKRPWVLCINPNCPSKKDDKN
ncbi:MAG: DNA topoisomerase I [Candidatus Aenigmarchaeota archaeon]|nr:DNA topoisomerase I [Candidatus Aenigmarchaeota archaeon]